MVDMRHTLLALALAAASLLLPAGLQAQGRGNGGQGKGGGPPFCRSGDGHPVYGRAWCIEKGFTVGGQDWRSFDAGRVRIETRGDRDVDRGGLVDILGDILLGRFEEQRASLHAIEPLRASWLTPDDGPRVLQVWAGPIPLGELVDNDRNGTVDLAVMRFGR
jgi:hypothetical protein